MACAVHALHAEHPWVLPSLARLDKKDIEGCETVCSNGDDDVASMVQDHRQHAAYKQNCNTRAPALTGLDLVTLASDIHVCFNHHAKAQTRWDIFVKGVARTTRLDGFRERAADVKL